MTELKLVEEYEDLLGHDIEVWECSCGRQHSIQAGGDIACCPCEVMEEGYL